MGVCDGSGVWCSLTESQAHVSFVRARDETDAVLSVSAAFAQASLLTDHADDLAGDTVEASSSATSAESPTQREPVGTPPSTGTTN